MAKRNSIGKKVLASVLSVTLVVPSMSSIIGTAAETTKYTGKLYTSKSSNGYDAYKAAGELNVEVMSEGITLLKKGGTLPLSNTAKISVFGKNSVSPVYGGSGSAGGTSAGDVTLLSALDDEGFDVNPELVKFYNNDELSGSGRGSISMGTTWSKGLNTGETAVDKYPQSVTDSYKNYSDAAVVVISRIGGEGFDLPRQSVNTEGRSNQWEHYFQLDDNEEAMLEMVKANFDKVIVLLNCPTQMQVPELQADSGIDDILWIGCPGTTGFTAVAEALSGKVNPSGSTVDIWASDFTQDPTYYNLAKNDNIAYKYENYGTADQKVKDEYSANGQADSTVDSLNTYGEVTNRYFNELGEAGTYHQTAYEEGIYYGYRYYETRAAAYDGAVTINNEETFKDGDAWYDASVTYPFGYGLSYTEFEWTTTWKVTSAAGTVKEKITAKTDKIIATVTVKNVGDVAGKDTVQLYYSAPYFEGGIEKSNVVLAGFEKTKLLAPNESETVTIEIDASDMASYDYNDANGNGWQTYELDAGNYNVYVGENSHDAWTGAENSSKLKVEVVDEGNGANGIIVNIDTALEGMYDGMKSTNQYNTSSAYFVAEGETIDGVEGMGMDEGLSRADWNATWPTPPTLEDLTVTQDWLDSMETRKWMESKSTMKEGDALEEAFEKYDTGADWERDWSDMYAVDENGNTVKATSNKGLWNTGKAYTKDNPAPIQLIDMAGVAYDDDEAWAKYLSQLTISQMSQLISDSGFKITCDDYEALGMAYVTIGDGGTGYTRVGDANTTELTAGNTYCSTPMMAATWNFDLMVELGEMMGEEGIWLDMQGLYGPGTDLHRSPFGGRNFEYFAEDPYLAGKIAAAYVIGAQSKGVIPFSKHFFMNDTETNRDTEGLVTWATEQAIREIYLKNAEIMVKEGNAMGFMTAFNRIGYEYLASDDYATLTNVLRNEWGFTGILTTDAFNNYQDTHAILRAGANVTLNMNGSGAVLYNDQVINNATSIYWIRRSVQQICYTMLRMNSMNKTTEYADNLNAESTNLYYIAGDTVNFSVASDMMNAAIKADSRFSSYRYALADDYSLTNADVDVAVSYSDAFTALGLSIADDGTVTGTIPANCADGIYDLTFGIKVIEDGEESWIGWQTASFSITVGELKYLDQNVAIAQIAEPFEMYVQAGKGAEANNGNPEYKIVGGELPAGLSLSKDGKITGTPTAAGKYSFTLSASTGKAATDNVIVNVLIYVNDYYGTIEYEACDLPDATVGEFYIASVGTAVASGNHGITYSFVESSGGGNGGSGGGGGAPAPIDAGPGGPGGFGGSSNVLPEGLQITANGIIYGVPTEAEEGATFKVTASAAGYEDVECEFTLNILAADAGEAPGETVEGKGIVSVEKTSEGLVDTYTITYDDGTTYVFTVTNGADGAQGPVGPAGADGKDAASGCSSSLAGTAIATVSVMVVLAGSLVFRKKED